MDTKYVEMTHSHTYPDHTNSLAVCVAVVACNHLMLSLKEASGRPSTSMETVSYSFSRPTNVIFADQASDVTCAYVDQLQTVPLPKHNGSTNWDHQQNKLGQELDTAHMV